MPTFYYIYPTMNRAAFRDLGILSGIVLILFYPLFFTHYFYTDEIIQLAHYRPGAAFDMFTEQGRFITGRIFYYLFSRIDTIRQITFLRLFSLLGWMCCIPIWYTILTKVCRQENLPRLLPFFTVLYLITCPPFCVYVSWASCMELFIANTSGLLAGYIVYSNIKQWPAGAMAVALLFGLISLFTYQNGFGCFLLPFLLHLLAKRAGDRTILVGIGLYLLTYLLYYILFRIEIKVGQFDPAGRTGFSMDPLHKIAFFFARPLSTAFHFTWILNEQQLPGKLIYLLIGGIIIVLNVLLLRSRSLFSNLRYGIGVLFLLGLIYLPSLIVRENYASNRTLLGLDIAVFLLVFITLLQTLRTTKQQFRMAALLGILFVANAWYNFRYGFLRPVQKEVELVRTYIEKTYHPGITNIAFIRPSQQLFQHLYGIDRSWDEFGVPSTYPQWVPIDFVRQVVWEKTGRRAAADSLVIGNWPDKQQYLASKPTPDAHTLTIDVEQIIQ
jgi:hypothetical protein